MKESIAPSRVEVEDFLSELNLVVEKQIIEGHLSLPIYRCVDLSGQGFVIKIGSSESGKKEVEDNLYGYKKMQEMSIDDLIPQPISEILTPWGPAILMSDLGKSFAKTSTTAESTRVSFVTFGECLVKITKNALRDKETQGLEEVTSQIKKWIYKLKDADLVGNQIVAKLEEINLKQISGKKSSWMLLDFTPDNVFVNNNTTKFIDPWRQTTYFGTPIPSIAQFITLSEDIYHLSGFNNENLNYTNLISNLGQIMNLSDYQLHSQIALGKALQYSLSSFVRIESKPDMAEVYANKCNNIIKSL